MAIIAKKNDALINEQIRFPEVIVIGPKGEKLGMKKIQDAQTLASYAGFDLVLMSSKPQPICRIMDYNKYRYEKQKKQKEQQKRQKESNLELKEYRLSVGIQENDMNTKLTNAKKYLGKGHKIKASIRFRGREMAHPDKGRAVLLKFAQELEDISIIEAKPKMEGRQMFLLLAPNK